MIIFGILCILVCFWGLDRAFKAKSILIFVWVVLCYYTLTAVLVCVGLPDFSLLSNSFEENYWAASTKWRMLINIFLCNCSFLLSDYFFSNKKVLKYNDIGKIPQTLAQITHATFWISLVLVFIRYYGEDYSSFVSSADGGGWGMVLLQLTSCTNFYLVMKRKWLGVVVTIMVVFMIVVTTHVRSLLFYPIMPILIYYTYDGLYKYKTLKSFSLKALPFVGGLLCLAFILSVLRSGYVKLPEVNLAQISLDVLDYHNNSEPDTWSSLINYFWGFFTPFNKVLNIDYIPPQSIPHYNALVSFSYKYAYMDDAIHYPATIYHDLLLSFGNFAFVAAFFFYTYLKFISDYVQSSTVRLFLFSSIYPWHIYMLLRGSTDYSSAGISYSLVLALMVLIIYDVLTDSKKNLKYR